MQYGVCGGPDLAAAAAKASFDFAEWSVGELLKPQEPRHAFEAELDQALAAAIPFPVLNCLVPGDLKITGPDADTSKLEEYVTTTFQRAEQARVETIVFGSGGARSIPDGFDIRAAREQLVRFCSMLAPIAGQNGVTVVVEPLNRAECNVLTTIAECATLVREVAHPALRLLVDAYHLSHDNDSYSSIVDSADILSHMHIATVPTRLAPAAEPCDFFPFFEAIAEAGYDGRISIEAGIPDPENDLPAAISLMKSLEKSATEAQG